MTQKTIKTFVDKIYSKGPQKQNITKTKLMFNILITIRD